MTFDFVRSGLQPLFTGRPGSNGTFVVGLEDLSGSTCVVQKTTNLLTPSWSAVTNFTVSGGITNLVLPLEPDPSAYFKVECLTGE